MVLGLMHCDDDGDGFEEAIRGDALGGQLMSVSIIDLVDLLGALFDLALSHIPRNVLAETRKIPLVVMHDCGVEL